MEVEYSYVVYSLAIAWFTYHVFWMVMRIYQFKAYSRTYGARPNITLRGLAEHAGSNGTELPAFRVVVPAYQESSVIEGTIRRLAAMNYPRTHFEIVVVVYEDEPQNVHGRTTRAVVERVARELNQAAHSTLVWMLVVPAGYDGFFPGSMNAEMRHVGKARGLNFALRAIHEHNERDERALYIGKMRENGHLARLENTLQVVEKRFADHGSLQWALETVFNPDRPEYVGALVYSSQLLRIQQLCTKAVALGGEAAAASRVLMEYVGAEAPRFYMSLDRSDPGGGPQRLSVLPDKQFLFNVMREVEQMAPSKVDEYIRRRIAEMRETRPVLSAQLSGAGDPGELYQLVRQCNSRWMMVYDADADAPLDVMRHLAARILTEPETLGFQGPIAPLLNYDDVHALCRMGAMWMAFWHGSAYPRLLNNPRWAHPLAGTNWCFRIEGFEHEGRLVRECRYEEARRRFLLQFDPRQLTEDLEAGLRLYDRWGVNAAWLPVVEMEQVPPTAGKLFSQHSRWALGTLQTLAYILKSGLPWTQKVWYALYPLRVVFASSGPFITIGLVVALAAGWLVVEPIFAWWTVGLIFGNVVYVWAFAATFERYYDMRIRGEAVEYIHRNAGRISNAAREWSAGGKDERGALHLLTERLERGLEDDGFVAQYLASRCTEGAPAQQGEPGYRYLAHLESATPARLRENEIHEIVAALKSLLEADTTRQADVNPDSQGDCPELERLHELVDNAVTRAGVNRTVRWSRYHNQILIWAIPFIYFSVTPFFKAFWLWMKGEQREWNKTERTPKSYDAQQV